MVFTVESFLAEDAGKAVDDFRPKDLYEFRTFTGTRFEITRAATTTVFEKKKGADANAPETWAQTAPAPAKAPEASTIEDFLSKVSNLRAQAFVGALPAGATEVARTVARWNEGKKEETVVFYKAGDDLFATRGTEVGAVTLMSSDYDDVIKSLEAIEVIGARSPVARSLLGLLALSVASGCASRSPAAKAVPAPPPSAAATGAPVVEPPRASDRGLATSPALARELEQIFSAPALTTAVVSALVQSLDTGEVLYRLNPDTLVVPASNQKIVTMAVGAARLGWDYRYETRLESSAPVDAGVAARRPRRGRERGPDDQRPERRPARRVPGLGREAARARHHPHHRPHRRRRRRVR